jgi:hypothetical protein
MRFQNHGSPFGGCEIGYRNRHADVVATCTKKIVANHNVSVVSERVVATCTNKFWCADVRCHNDPWAGVADSLIISKANRSPSLAHNRKTKVFILFFL